MTTFDFSPLFRSTVGFDRLMRLMESSTQLADATNGYPPYNIEKTGDDQYRITVAVAGFGDDELSVETHENTCSSKGARTRPTAKPAISIAASPAARSSGSSRSPTTSKSSAHRSATACW